MGYLPIFMNLRGRDCLVVGGGPLAENRVKALAETEAAITLVATEITPRLAGMAEAGQFRHHAREYIRSDMHGRFMAWAATADITLARTVAGDAHAMGVIVNGADQPELCDFITPAVVKRGDVQIAIATGGASPALARHLRERLEITVGPEYGALAEILRRARGWLRGRVADADQRARILRSLLESDLLDAIRRDDSISAERLLQRHLGAGLTELDLSFDPDHEY